MNLERLRRPFTAITDAVRGIWSGPFTARSPEAAQLWGAPATSSGMGVNETTALTYSAFWACVQAIATDCASLPLILYKRTEGTGKTRYVTSKLYQLLHDEPNPEMTSMTFRQTLTAHALTWGGGFAEIQRDGADKPMALWPLTPDRVTPTRNDRQQIIYRVTRANGGYDELPARDMLHIPGLGFDGLIGYSVVAKARESIGLGLATERFGGAFFGNGSTFGGVISLADNQPLTEAAEKNFREKVQGAHQGVDRAHKFLLLGNGAKYSRLGIPPNDAQFLETRLFQIEELCRWFRMPPHKIQHLLRSTFANIEHQGIEYYIDTLRPWLVRWEQEINRKLIPSLERRSQFTEHLIEGALRGDLTSRYAAYAIGRQWGWESANSVLEKENRNPIPNGDLYLVPLNMTPADRINEVIDAQIKAKTAPPPPPAGGAVDPNAADTTGRALEAIREALAAAEARVQTHLGAAAAADARALTLEGTAEQHEAEATIERNAATAAQQQVSTLQALVLEAQQRSDREQAERDGLKAALEAQGADLATMTGTATAAEAQVLQLTADVAAVQQALVDAQARVEAERATAMEERTAWRVATDEATAATKERDRVHAELLAARETAEHAAAAVSLQLGALEGRAVVLEQAVEAERTARAVAEAPCPTCQDVGLLPERGMGDPQGQLPCPDCPKGAQVAAEIKARDAQQAADLAKQAAVTLTLDVDAAEGRVTGIEETLATEREAATRTAAAVQRHLFDVSVAVRAAVVDRLAWMVDHEADRARAKQGSPDKLRTWIADFYTGDCSERYRGILRPSVKAWVVCTNHPEPVEHVLDLLIAQHVEQSVRQLRAVANESDVETLPAALEKVLRRWEASRAETLADRVLKEAA